MVELLEGIGHNIRWLRVAKGWNQTELGFHADTSPSIISLIENGKRNPSTATLAKIAGALGVEVVALFPKGQAPLPDFEGERRFVGAADLPQFSGLLLARMEARAERALERAKAGELSADTLQNLGDAALDVSDTLLDKEGLSEVVHDLHDGNGVITRIFRTLNLASREVAAGGEVMNELDQRRRKQAG